MEISYLRGACGVTKWDGENNESVYERCGMGSRANGVNCGVEELVKRNTLRWLGHVERMGNEELVKKVYIEKLWVPTVEEGHLRYGGTEEMSTCVREVLPEGRGWLDQTKREWLDRERWRLLLWPSLGGHSRRERGIRDIDR